MLIPHRIEHTGGAGEKGRGTATLIQFVKGNGIGSVARQAVLKRRLEAEAVA